jgi:hypothetical protein
VRTSKIAPIEPPCWRGRKLTRTWSRLREPLGDLDLDAQNAPRIVVAPEALLYT